MWRRCLQLTSNVACGARSSGRFALGMKRLRSGFGSLSFFALEDDPLSSFDTAPPFLLAMLFFFPLSLRRGRTG